MGIVNAFTVIFLISVFGYYLGYSILIKRANAWFPILYIASSVLLIYLFGLIGLLKAGLYVLLAGGIILIPYLIFRKKKEISSVIRSVVTDPSLIYMIAGVIWVYAITKNVGISHADDFSHWYRICKMMHFESAYPTMPDMSFTTYAPGTATWIWIITEVTGFSPDRCLFAHSLINLAALNSFFSLIREGKGKASKISVFVFACIMSVALCSMDVNTYCLLTDTTIALVPMAAVFLILSMEGKAGKTDYILITVLMCFEILIKVSGIPFVVFAGVLLAKRYKDASDTRVKRIMKLLIPSAVPLIVFYAYVIRANMVFGHLELAGQGFSVTRFIAMFLIKSGEQIKAITGRFFYEIFVLWGDVSMQVRLVWLVFAVAAVSLYLLRKDKDFVPLRKLMASLFAFFVIYAVLLLLTYLFSMYSNEADAEHLNSFYRYMGSVTIFVYGCGMYLLYGILSRRTPKIEYAGCAAMCAASLAITVLMFDAGFVMGYGHYKTEEVFTTNAWDYLNKYAQERYEYNEDVYLVIYNPEDVADDYELKIKLASEVYFRSNNINILSVDEIGSGEADEDIIGLDDIDHVVILGDQDLDLESFLP